MLLQDKCKPVEKLLLGFHFGHLATSSVVRKQLRVENTASYVKRA